MSDIYKGELQDYEGNTIYPHSEADVIFCTDGETAQSKLNKYEEALGDVTGVTDSLEVDDSKILVSAKALHKVNSSLNGMKFGKDGDGNCGYYGADGSLIPFNRIKKIPKSLSVSSGWKGYTYRTITLVVPELTEIYGVMYNYSTSFPIVITGINGNSISIAIYRADSTTSSNSWNGNIVIIGN